VVQQPSFYYKTRRLFERQRKETPRKYERKKKKRKRETKSSNGERRALRFQSHKNDETLRFSIPLHHDSRYCGWLGLSLGSINFKCLYYIVVRSYSSEFTTNIIFQSNRLYWVKEYYNFHVILVVRSAECWRGKNCLSLYNGSSRILYCTVVLGFVFNAW
jgi:hypothetical protein